MNKKIPLFFVIFTILVLFLASCVGGLPFNIAICDNDRCELGEEDLCPSDCEEVSAEEDSDGDGIADSEDASEGYDDAIDTDADTVPDGCDKCDGDEGDHVESTAGKALTNRSLQLRIVKETPTLLHNGEVEPFLLAQLPESAVANEVAFAKPGTFVGSEEEVQHQWQKEDDGSHRLRIDETIPCANAYWGVYIYLTPRENKSTPKLEIRSNAELTTESVNQTECAVGGARIYAKWYKGKIEIGNAVVSNVLTAKGEGDVNGTLVALLGNRPADADGVGILLQHLQTKGTALFDDLKVLDTNTNNVLFETSFEESAVQYYASPFLNAGHRLLVLGVAVSSRWEEGQPFVSSEPIIRAIQSVLEVDPEIDFLLTIDITPPAWWIAAHPDEAARSTKGTLCTRDSRPMPSHSSDIFFSEVTEKLEMFLQEVHSSDVGGHVLGVTTHLAEWIVPESTDGDLNNSLCDESNIAQQAFRAFLNTRYSSDDVLQAAWSNSEVTLLTAAIPTPSQRRSIAFVSFDQQVQDFHEFVRAQTAARIIQVGRAARNGFGDRGLFGTYGGYWLFETRVLTHTLAGGGHLAVADLLDDKTIDFFVGPVDYVNRGAGDVGGSMSLPDVFLNHGKVWVDELDLRTHLSWDRAQQATETLVESQEVIRRETARSAISGAGAWFYDILEGAFHDPDLIDTMTESRKFFASVATHPHREDAAWLIIDDRALTYTTGDTVRMMLPLLFEQQQEWLSSGIPIQTWLWKDAIQALNSGAHPHMVIFLGPYIHDTSSEKALTLLRSRTGTLVVYVSSIPLDEHGDIISGTALAVGPLDPPRAPSATVTTDALEVFGIFSGMHVGNKQSTAPLLDLTRVTGDVFARMDDDGAPAWVWQSSTDAASLFMSSLPDLPRGLLRFLWEQSGGTLGQDLGDSSLDMLQRGYGVIHCASEHVVEARSGASLFVNGTFVQWLEPVPCTRAETLLYSISEKATKNAAVSKKKIDGKD